MTDSCAKCHVIAR